MGSTLLKLFNVLAAHLEEGLVLPVTSGSALIDLITLISNVLMDKLSDVFLLFVGALTLYVHLSDVLYVYW